MRVRILVLALAPLILFGGCTYECNAELCPDGCCGADGVCFVGGSDRYCGGQGAACVDCGAQQKVCTAGACTPACVHGQACQSSAECCSSLICWEGGCGTCRLSGETCMRNGDCCGGRRCERPNPALAFICR